MIWIGENVEYFREMGDSRTSCLNMELKHKPTPESSSIDFLVCVCVYWDVSHTTRVLVSLVQSSPCYLPELGEEYLDYTRLKQC